MYPDPEPLRIDCPNCGADVIEGLPHDCPVTGGPVTIESTELTPEEQAMADLAEAGLERSPVSLTQEAVDIRNDASQRNFDQLLVGQAIRSLREVLAQEKLNYQLAKAGIAEGGKGGHPEQVKRNIKQIREQLAMLIEFSNSGEEIPLPSDLEIASELPKQGEAAKMGLA